MLSLGTKAALGLLLATLAVGLLACQDGAGERASTGLEPLPTVQPAPTATPTPPPPSPSPSPAATPSPEPTSPPTPEAPAAAAAVSAELSPATVRQGQVFTVRLGNAGDAASATTTFAGLLHPMLWTGDIWWAVVGVAADLVAGSYEVQVTADGTIVLPAPLLTVVEAAFPEQFITLGPEQSQLLTDPAAIESERQLLVSLYAVVTPERLWSGPFVLPVAGPLGDTFGMRRSFNGGPFVHHTGVDILAEEGQAVVAANRGRVAFAGELHLRGNTVIIDHGAAVFSGYHHLAQVLVAQGQEVAQGEVIGTIGATGLATAPHLHWEMIVHDVRVNPLPWTEGEIGP